MKFWQRLADSTGVPVEGLSFIYDACDFVQQSIVDGREEVASGLRHFTAAEYCAALLQLAQERLGADCAGALNSWRLDTSEKLGRAFYALIDLGLLQRQEGDLLSDFDGQYDLRMPVVNPSVGACPYPLEGLPDYRNQQWIKAFNAIGRVLRAIVLLFVFAALSGWIGQYSEPIPPMEIFFGLLLAAFAIWSRIKRPFRFSVRELLITMTIVAIALGTFAALTQW